MIHDQPLGALADLAVADTPRTRFYSGVIDRILDRALAGFQFELFPFGDSLRDGDLTRETANLTGLMAFCWASRLSRHHADPRLLAHVKARLAEFARTQTDGAVLFRGGQRNGYFPQIDPARNGLHIAWAIEPLVLAALWIDSALADDERAVIRRMARRAADLITAIPCNERNNRGAVRCAVMALLGRFLGDSDLVDEAIHDFHRAPVSIFNAHSGQINEGPGPDGNYSGTSFIYLYTYRILSGDDTVEDRLLAGARWYTWAADPLGCPAFPGASTRVAITKPAKVVDFLPALERFAARFPHFGWLIENGYKAAIEPGGPGHAVSPLIWALLEHEGRPAAEDPDWFAHRNLPHYNPAAGPEFMVIDEGCDSLYLVFREAYHAAVTLCGRAPYKGLQNWSYRLEPPVLWPSVTHASATRAFGLDTSRMRVSGTKFHDRLWREGPPHLFVCRFDEAWFHFVLTPTTLLHLRSCALPGREDRFVIHQPRCGCPILEPGLVRYEGRQGRLHFTGAQPELRTLRHEPFEDHPRGWTDTHLLFRGPDRTRLYAFSNDSFRLLRFEPEGDTVRFADDTGEYELSYSLRFYSETDTVPIGDKGFGFNDLAQRLPVAVKKIR